MLLITYHFLLGVINPLVKIYLSGSNRSNNRGSFLTKSCRRALDPPPPHYTLLWHVQTQTTAFTSPLNNLCKWKFKESNYLAQSNLDRLLCSFRMFANMNVVMYVCIYICSKADCSSEHVLCQLKMLRRRQSNPNMCVRGLCYREVVINWWKKKRKIEIMY